MRIDTICNIIDAKLLNKPSINLVATWTTNIDKVEDGSLFVAIDKGDIPKAIASGAYAILSQNIDQTDIKQDEDIAWIKVVNLELACIKIRRFQLTGLDVSGFICDDITMDIFQTIIKKNNHIIFLTGDIFDDFDCIHTKPSSKIYISTDSNYIDKLIPNPGDIDSGDENDVSNIVCHSLFETSFVFSGYSFDRIRLPALYIKQFLNIFEFIKSQRLSDIKVDITMLKHLHIFSPLFVDTRLHIADFGKTNSFVLANESTSISRDQIQYIKQKFGFLRLNIVDGLMEPDQIRKAINTEKNINYISGLSYKKIKDILSQKSLICIKSSLF